MKLKTGIDGVVRSLDVHFVSTLWNVLLRAVAQEFAGEGVPQLQWQAQELRALQCPAMNGPWDLYKAGLGALEAGAVTCGLGSSEIHRAQLHGPLNGQQKLQVQHCVLCTYKPRTCTHSGSPPSINMQVRNLHEAWALHLPDLRQGVCVYDRWP